MDELLSIKRRAPPRLFRNRRQINEQSASRRPEEAQWRRRQPFEPAHSTAFLPALDLEMPHVSPASKHARYRPSGGPVRAPEISATPRGDSSHARPYFIPEGVQWTTLPDPANGRGQALMTGEASGTPTPMGSSSEGSFVPSPQQIVQAMARSRVANASTPTTPKMSPWRKAMWSTDPNRDGQQMPSEQVSTSLLLGQANQSGPRRASMPGSHLREWNNTNMPLHYVIAPEIRPLQVPSPGPRPLPIPSDADQWSADGMLLTADPCRPNLLIVPLSQHRWIPPIVCRTRSKFHRDVQRCCTNDRITRLGTWLTLRGNGSQCSDPVTSTQDGGYPKIRSSSAIDANDSTSRYCTSIVTLSLCSCLILMLRANSGRLC